MFHPPPRRAASPTGAIPHRRTATEADNLSAVDAITLTEIQFLLPVHRIRGYRQTLPAPLRGREEALEAPGGGGGRLLAWKRRLR